MSVDMEQKGDAVQQTANDEASQDELSDVDVDEDGSSSLSDIEDKDAEQEGDAEASDDLSNPSDENDSEAETERLEESPHNARKQMDVVLSSRNDTQTYERSPSKLHNQITAEYRRDEEDEDPLSDDDISINDSVKSSLHEDAHRDPRTAETSLEDSSGEGKKTLSITDTESRKRKRSIMAGSGLDVDPEEPLRKRTGSVNTPGDEYAIDDDINPDEEGDTSNPISGNISGDEGMEAQDDGLPEDAEETIVAEEENQETIEIPVSPKKRGRKKKKVVENGAHTQEEDHDVPQVGDLPINGEDEDNADNEGDDEAGSLLKNEEELEKKRIAIDQLSMIERHFATFRDRLYDERLEQLNREEAMLRQDKPTHPGYLAMLQCIDARRDERLRVSDRLREYELQSLKNYAVGRRSQILVQYQQEVREIRERKLEQLGKQWYEIQHDRRSYAGSVPDYTLKFPTRRSEQVTNQVAYSNEVSILSGVAKYIGFPAAPPMASATATELEEDMEKMGRTKQARQVQQTSLPLQELAALRSAGSTSRFKPAEEQFIEQTPWANPQHPSHAHLLQRQTSAQHAPRTTSPFSHVQVQARRHSHQIGAGGPVSGTFSSTPSFLHHTNGQSGGPISPHQSFANSAHTRTADPVPLSSRQTSSSPPRSRPPPALADQQHTQDSSHKDNGNQQSASVPASGLPDTPRDFPPDMRREPVTAMMARF